MTMNRALYTPVVTAVAIAALLQACTPPEPDARFDVQDRLDIINLLNSYSHNIDGGRVEKFVQMFSEDALFETRFPGSSAMQFVGHEGIRGLAEGAKARAATGNQRRHRLTNIVFHEQTQTSARISCYLLLTSTANERLQALDLSGQYDGELVKVAGQWKISRWILLADNGLALPTSTIDEATATDP